MTIHSDNPFATPSDQRDQFRQLRGRLVASVSVAASGDENRRYGVTVSSLWVVEGDEPLVAVLVGAGSEFAEVSAESEAFTAHVLSETHRPIAEVFAGMRPAPGGMFESTSVSQSEWGPRLDAVADWAGCRLAAIHTIGTQQLVTGLIEHVELSDLVKPLTYFRGAYRSLRS
ncbi:hypothetical protein BH23ACT5_BH23ACT5_13500 [soil metagenome]